MILAIIFLLWCYFCSRCHSDRSPAGAQWRNPFQLLVIPFISQDSPYEDLIKSTFATFFGKKLAQKTGKLKNHG
jgi:hypothetical protein